MGFLDEGLSSEEFDEPEGLSEFLDVFLHRGNDVAGEIVVESVKLLSQFNRLLEELLVDQFFELIEVVFEEGTIESLLFFEVELHGCVPDLEIGDKGGLHGVKLLVSGNRLFEHLFPVVEGLNFFFALLDSLPKLISLVEVLANVGVLPKLFDVFEFPLDFDQFSVEYLLFVLQLF